MELDAKAEPVVRKAGYWRTLLRGLLILFGLPALGLMLHLVLASGPTMGIVLVLCLPSVFLMKEYGASGFGLALLAVCITALTVFRLDDFERLTDGVRLRDASLNQARANPEATVFYFKNVTLQRELLTEYRYRRKGKNQSDSYYFAAPLTDDNWTTSSPVEAWVIGHSFESVKRWDPSLQTGIRLSESSSDSTHLQSCLSKALESHSLSAVPDPLLLKWADPDVEYQKAIEELKHLYVGSIIFWLVAWTIYWVMRGRKH